MGSFEPIREPNAVDQCTFALQLSRQFNNSEIEGLQSLRASLSEEFPQISDINLAGFEFGPNGMQHHMDRVAGIRFFSEQKLHPHKIVANRPNWQLDIGPDMLKVHSLSYDSWPDVSRRAIEFINKVISELGASDITATQIVLQFNDVFLYDGEESDYQQNSLFQNASHYLTTQSAKSGHLWHVHQGWFQDCSGHQVLNILNIGTKKDAGAPHLTVIEHAMRYNHLVEVKNVEDELLNGVFGELHSINKAVVSDLLVSDMKERIGLL